MPKTRAQQSAKLSSQSQEELTNNDHASNDTLAQSIEVSHVPNNSVRGRKRRRIDNASGIPEIPAIGLEARVTEADSNNATTPASPQELLRGPPYSTRNSEAQSASYAAQNHAIQRVIEGMTALRSNGGDSLTSTLSFGGFGPDEISAFLPKLSAHNATAQGSPGDRKGKSRSRRVATRNEEDEELRSMSTRFLEGLAQEILHNIVGSSFEDILNHGLLPDSEVGQRHMLQVNLLNNIIRSVYARQAFIDSEDLDASIVRKVNLATLLGSLFGNHEVGWAELDENFITLFKSEPTSPTRRGSELWIDLKVQAYIAAVVHGDYNAEDVLRNLFPTDLKERLLSNLQGSKRNDSAEADILSKVARVFSELHADSRDSGQSRLPSKYPLEAFLRDVHTFTQQLFQHLVHINPPDAAHSENNIVDLTMHANCGDGSGLNSATQNSHSISESGLLDTAVAPSHTIGDKSSLSMEKDTADLGSTNLDGQFSHHEPMSTPSNPVFAGTSTSTTSGSPLDQGPYFHRQGQASTYNANTQYPVPQNMQQAFQNVGNVGSQDQQSQEEENSASIVGQSAPTQILYERARQAATAKASPSNRRAGTPSQRRPWTQEEENALMTGLDRVQGPHWSQILGLFGPGGSENEVLKDRNQVQLKDKARNLKLFFLKSGHEVPYYLQFVTGELKTRAPAQAAKYEAREKQKMNEDQGSTQVGGTSTDDGSNQRGDHIGKSPEDPEESLQDAEGSPDIGMESDLAMNPPLQQSASIAPMFPNVGFSADFEAQLAAAAAAATGEGPH